MSSGRSGWLIGVALVVSACASGGVTTAAPSPVVAALASAGVAASAGAAPVSPTAPPASPSPLRTPLPSILPGEPWIAFQTMSSAGYGVHLVRPDGTGFHRWPAKIPGTQEHPDWSRDGQRILVNAVDADGVMDLWVADADGAHEEQLLDCEAPCVWANEASWSPDGRTIAFHRGVVEDGVLRSTLELLDVASKTTSVVLTMPVGQVVLAPRWSPDGKHLVVEVIHLPQPTVDAEPDGGGIGVVDLSAAKPAVDQLLAFDTFAQSPDWSPSGDRIVYTQPTGDYSSMADLVTITPDGGSPRQITDVAATGGSAFQPTYTSDGSQVVFLLTRPGRDESVMAIVSSRGAELHAATSDDYRDGFHPRLRPGP
jgi:Tol biopolymer transport system component